MAWWGVLAAVVIAVASYFLTPKPEDPKPPALRDLEGPTGEAGRPIPVVFGTVTIKSPNVLWDGENSTVREKVKV